MMNQFWSWNWNRVNSYSYPFVSKKNHACNSIGTVWLLREYIPDGCQTVVQYKIHHGKFNVSLSVLTESQSYLMNELVTFTNLFWYNYIINKYLLNYFCFTRIPTYLHSFIKLLVFDLVDNIRVKSTSAQNKAQRCCSKHSKSKKTVIL